MIWADRGAIGSFVLSFVVLSYFLEAPKFGVELPMKVAAIFACITWVILRTLDFMVTGQLRLSEKDSHARQTRERPATRNDPSIGVIFPPELIEKIDRWAVENHTSRSEAIRRLIEQALTKRK